MKNIFVFCIILSLSHNATASWEAAVAFFDDSSEQNLSTQIIQHQNDLLKIQKIKNRNFKLHQKNSRNSINRNGISF